MRSRSTLLFGASSFFVSVAACSGPTEPPRPSAAPRGVAAQGIVNGSLDTSAGNATVAVTLGPPGGGIFGACTGALVKVDRAEDVAYVLTAAHCVTGGAEAVDVRFGTDWSDPDQVVPAAATTVDPDWDANNIQDGHDFAVVALRNLPATLPAPYGLPGANDGLGEGSTVTLKGYGNTISYGNPAKPPSARPSTSACWTPLRTRSPTISKTAAPATATAAVLRSRPTASSASRPTAIRKTTTWIRALPAA